MPAPAASAMAGSTSSGSSRRPAGRAEDDKEKAPAGRVRGSLVRVSRMSSERKPTAGGPAAREPARDPAARVAALIEEIRRHDRLYFEEAAPVIADAEYDELVRE